MNNAPSARKGNGQMRQESRPMINAMVCALRVNIQMKLVCHQTVFAHSVDLVVFLLNVEELFRATLVLVGNLQTN